MNIRKHAIVIGAAVVAVVALGSVLQAGSKRKQEPAPREATLTGKVVDLHCYMTGKFASTDAVKCTRECIRVGVPAALETEEGLVIIGRGAKGAARDIAPLALKTAELKGMLYERHGLRYIDIVSAKAAKKTSEEEWEEADEEESEADDWESDEDDEPEEEDESDDY